MLNRRTLLTAAAAAMMIGGVSATAAFAADYPSKPVKLVVPYPPGGPTDLVGRLVAQRLSDLWKQPVVVENKAGASGTIGSDYVARAEADGYTLILGNNASHGAYELLNPSSAPYHTLVDFAPVSLVALLSTLVLLFGFQGGQIIDQPLIIALLAVPILIQVYFNSGLAYLLNRASGEAHCVAAPSALIGASNFFELAVAAAISIFGFSSGAALATVVGVLIEVPVMLSVVKIVNASKRWYEAGPAVARRIDAAPTAGPVHD